MTRRADDRALFERWYDRGWRGAPMPHTVVGRPAVAVFNGELHVLARKSDGAIFDLRYSPFSGRQTTYLEGRVSGDPDVAVYGWRRRLHVVARDADGFAIQWWSWHFDRPATRAIRMCATSVISSRPSGAGRTAIFSPSGTTPRPVSGTWRVTES